MPPCRQDDYIQTNDVPEFLAHERSNMSDLITTRDAASIELVAGKIALANYESGWHDRYVELIQAGDEEGVREHIISKVMLVVAELAEGAKKLRNGRDVTKVYLSEDGESEGFPVEVAEAVIGLLDISAMLDIQIGKAIRANMHYNARRGHKDGGQTT